MITLFNRIKDVELIIPNSTVTQDNFEIALNIIYPKNWWIAGV
jgi:hypothetical protein